MEDIYAEPESDFFSTASHVFQSYGWHFLVVTVVVGFVYTKFKPRIDSYFQYKSDQAYAAKYHKDPDLVAARLAAQQRMIDEMQTNYNRDVENYSKKMEEKENKKRAEWLERNEGASSGIKLGNGKSEDKQKSLKPDYNPLMGNSSRNYRPPKKSCCGKGGCG